MHVESSTMYGPGFLSHLYDCPDCLATLQACFPPLPEVEVARLDTEDKQYAIDMRQSGWWRTKAFAPPLKVHGPPAPDAGHRRGKSFQDQMGPAQ